jgi:hypothetical protein
MRLATVLLILAATASADVIDDFDDVSGEMASRARV